ncbi:MAG: hypothetical protein GY809_24470 [Planctomycetes bacterium]|nr:hypothetical protein [Planctomycetota bacterium]
MTNHRILHACLVLVLMIVAQGCSRKEAARTPPDTFSVFYTCDTRGHIEPCGCTSGMAGGLSRRQTYLVGDRPRDYLLVDAGDVTAGGRAWERLEFEYILKGYQIMGYHAVNLGVRELSLGAEALTSMQTHCAQLVSANVVGQDRTPVCQPYVIVDLSNGFRCGITGVVDDQVMPEALGPGLSVLPAAEALASVLPKMQGKADYLVLLAFTSEPVMKALAQQFFELDLIVGGQVQKASAGAVIENRSAIVFNTDKGKAVGRLDLTWGADQNWTYENRFKTLEETMTPDARFVDLIEQYKAQLKVLDFRPVKDDVDGLSSIAAGPKTTDRYAGPDTCKTCHPTAYAVWAKSKHAHAFATLEAKGHEYNPRCLICHAVGYMESDGYVNQRLTPSLVNVSCESCHGRGDVHAKAREDAPDSEHGMTTQTPDCTACHDQENSPKFDKASYLWEIAHGKEETSTTN